jgi:hypothetical protein
MINGEDMKSLNFKVKIIVLREKTSDEIKISKICKI